MSDADGARLCDCAASASCSAIAIKSADLTEPRRPRGGGGGSSAGAAIGSDSDMLTVKPRSDKLAQDGKIFSPRLEGRANRPNIHATCYTNHAIINKAALEPFFNRPSSLPPFHPLAPLPPSLSSPPLYFFFNESKLATSGKNWEILE